MNDRDQEKLGDYLKRNTITVGQLIEQLGNMDEDLPVVFSYNYGDHWRTPVAERAAYVDELPLVWSGYHSMPKLEPEDSYDEPGDGQAPTVCVIQS